MPRKPRGDHRPAETWRVKSSLWIQVMMAAILPFLAWLVLRDVDFDGRISNLEGRLETLFSLPGLVNNLQKEVGALQDDVDAIGPPEIVIEVLPSIGSGPDSRATISGKVRGVRNPQKYRVVIYALTDRWYVQPTADQPLTMISSDGKWTNWTHLGSSYAALLVDSSFRPAAVTDALPAVGNEIIVAVTADATAVR